MEGRKDYSIRKEGNAEAMELLIYIINDLMKADHYTHCNIHCIPSDMIRVH